MGTIKLQNVSKQFGGQVVLDEVTLTLHAGEMVGVVGPNGSGKTTLFRLIIGEVDPDVGTVTSSRGMRIGYLPQEPQVGLDNTLHDEVLSAFANVLALERRQQELSERMAQESGPALEALMRQYDRANARFIAAGGYAYEQRLNEILGGLGFVEADRALPMSALSGGQKCRAALAKLLLQDNSYLLLDEPTNHLDIDAVRWLEKFLASHHGGAAIIAHDRYLLDRVADRIIEIDDKRVTSYPGNYTNYARVRQLRRLTQERQYEKDQAFIEKERTFIARQHAAQRGKEAEGRRKRLERRLERGEFVLERPSSKREMQLDFKASSRGIQRGPLREGRTIFRVDDAAKRYAEKVLFEGLSLEIGAGQRFGITGPNGTGKTTLLRMMLGELPSDAGQIERNPKAVIGYYAQEPEDLAGETTALSEIMRLRPDLSELEARSYLARFLFTGDDVFNQVAGLSGGEQSRVRLAKLLLAAPNVLMLDEPTNHLDIPSREALEQALEEYGGTIIAVSHDRYFLDRIVDQLLVMRLGVHRQYNGNYSDYIRETEAEAEVEAAKTTDERRPRKRRLRPADTQRGAGRTRQRSRFDRLALQELESLIMQWEEEISELEAQFADPAVYRDGPAAARLRKQFEARRRELAEAQAAWERRVDEA